MPTTMQPNASTPTEQNPDWYGAVVHTEFGSTDVDATTAFLHAVFGMAFQKNDGPMDYRMAYTPGQPSVAVRPVMPQEAGPSQTPYIHVPDLDAAIAAVKAHGATMILERMELGAMAVAWFQAPGGPVLAMAQMLQGA